MRTNTWRTVDAEFRQELEAHLLASRVIELGGPRERERLLAIEASYGAMREL